MYAISMALSFASFCGFEARAAPHPTRLRNAAEARALIERDGGALLFSWSAPVDLGRTSPLVLRAQQNPAGTWAEKKLRFSKWPNGQAMRWSASFRPAQSHVLVMAQLDVALGFGPTEEFLYDAPDNDKLRALTDLFLIARTLEEGTSLTLDRISLNGQPLGYSLEAAHGIRGGEDVLRIRGGSLHRRFDMRGELRVRWPRGKRPRGESFSLELWGARVFEDDRTPPRVAIERPLANILINGVPHFRATYSDGGTGVDPASVELWLDDYELTAHAEVSAESVQLDSFGTISSCGHTLVVYASDQAGNEGRAEVSFAVDSNPPTIACSRPEAPSRSDPPPPIEVNFYDSESGVDPSSLKVLIDGIALAGPCEFSEDTALCPVPVLKAGLHEVEIQLKDRVGNLGVRRERVGTAVSPP